MGITLPGMVQNYAQTLQTITDLTQQTSLLGQNVAAETAYYSYLTALAEAQGTRQNLAINEYNSRASTQLDLQNLAIQTNYGLMNKQLELFMLDAQNREKLMGAFFEMEKNKLDNTFQRSKQILQSVKY